MASASLVPCASLLPEGRAATGAVRDTGIGGLPVGDFVFHAVGCKAALLRLRRSQNPPLKWRSGRRAAAKAMQGGGSSDIQVVISGAGSDLGRAAMKAVAESRGMRLAGAVDSNPSLAGCDAGELAGLEEPLEVPVLSDLVMVLASVAQGKGGGAGVLVDTGPQAEAYEVVRQATAFGLKSVVAGAGAMDEDKLDALSTFCSKASTGCVVAPTLSIGAALLQQAALVAGFHYGHVDVLESHSGPEAAAYPLLEARQLADALAGLGRTFNDGDASTASPARGALMEEGVRVHSMRHPGLLSSLEARFAGPGQVLSLRLDVADVRALVPGLLLAIRRVARLKSLVYGIEKLL